MNKLPVVLLSTLSSLENDSINFTIASYLLEHSADPDSLTIQKIADACHVGIASVSRFVREIGLNNFSDLKNIAYSNDYTFPKIHQRFPFQALKDNYMQAIQACTESVDYNMIFSLAHEIHASKTVAIFGLLKAEAAAISLQADLFALNKPALSIYNYKEQFEFIKKADSDTLIILFSDTSSYFKYYDIRALKEKLDYLNIWMISSGIPEKFIHHHISYRKPTIQISHPVQLLYISQSIAQVYASLISTDFQ